MAELPALVEDAADAERLAESCLRGAAPDSDLLDALTPLEVPLAELTTSAVSLRVAAADGRAFVHHELRHPLSIPEALAPELDAGDVVAQWRGGVLTAPKYFSAFVDAPLPSYDPNHRAKWRAHELLHRLSRFVWRPDITRFEAYVGSRLSELLPVVHWYGFDEIGRGKCAAHRGRVLRRELCDACEAAALPHWDVAPDTAAAAAHAREALEHLHTELDAVARELDTGRQQPTPRLGLDAASDAVGYLRGHWNRITAWSFGAWIELFARAGDDYFDAGEAMLAHTRALADRLLTRPVTVDPARTLEQRERRLAQDLGYRVCVMLEAMDEQAEAAVWPTLESLAAEGATESVCRELSDRLSMRPALAGGWLWRPPAPGSIDVLVDGLRSALPRSLADIDDEALRGSAKAFAAAPEFRGPGQLSTRFARFVGSRNACAVLEAWLLARPLVDLEAERFAAIPEHWTGAGRLRLNTTLRRGRFDLGALRVVLDWEDRPDVSPEVAAVHYGGAPRTFEVTAEVDAVLAGAEQGRWAGEVDVRRTLLDAGALVWLPTPR